MLRIFLSMRSYRAIWRVWLYGLLATTWAVANLPQAAGQSVSSSENRGKRIAEPTLESIPFNGKRAYGYLRQICELGSRKSGSPGMKKQQLLLAKHFEARGGAVSRQEFRIRDPRNGDDVPMANLVVEWHPRREKRILLCAHYDTRPYPDRDPDPRKRDGLFIGANDGASGVALLAEMAWLMPEFESEYGVDFVLFDGEEYVYSDEDQYFHGSIWFSRKYASNPPPYSYRWGVLLDMVGDAELHVYQERYSVSWADTRPLVDDIWRVARELGVREFIDRPRFEIRDDHLAVRNIAKIPCCNVIDFDYPRPGKISYWHTTEDTPDKCSPLSLAKVGWVIHEWLKRVK